MEAVENVQQLVVTELERRCRQEQHLVEHVAQRSLQGFRVSLGLLVGEQTRHLVGVLQVVRFIEDEQRQMYVEPAESFAPDVVERPRELLSGDLQAPSEALAA